MDDIEDKKAGVSEMMDILTETPEDPDVDDLMDELDKDIAKDEMKAKEEAMKAKEEEMKAKELPDAPTTVLPNVPTTVQPVVVKNEDEDLEAMLENLCSV